jgi:hypothetical protein
MSVENDSGQLGKDIDPKTGNFLFENAAEEETVNIWADLEARFMSPEQIRDYKRVKPTLFGFIPFVPGMVASFPSGDSRLGGIILTAKSVPDPEAKGVKIVLEIQAISGNTYIATYPYDKVRTGSEAVADLPLELQSFTQLGEHSLALGQKVRVDNLFDGEIAIINPVDSTIVVKTRLKEYVRQDQESWVQKIEDLEEREKYKYGLKSNTTIFVILDVHRVESIKQEANHIGVMAN